MGRNELCARLDGPVLGKADTRLHGANRMGVNAACSLVAGGVTPQPYDELNDGPASANRSPLNFPPTPSERDVNGPQHLVFEEPASLPLPVTAGETETASRLGAVDHRALADLYDRHVRPVYSLAVRIVRNHADAEDIVQEVFVQAWRQASRFDPARGSIASWLLMITRSRAIDRLRRGRALATRIQEASIEPEARRCDVADSPEIAVLGDEETRRVRRALERVPVDQRAAIELAYFEGLTHSEIANRLNQPLGTVKTRIRLGLIRLRDEIFRDTPAGQGECPDARLRLAAR